MWSDRVVVCAVDNASIPRAETIAGKLGLSCVDALDNVKLALMVGEQQLFLRRATNPVMDWHIDFLSSAYTERRAKRTRKNDALARAIGLNKNAGLRVLDMSAGLGKDAHWLAYCGASVTLLERNPVLALLLQEAINALRADPGEGAVGMRMTLIQNEAAAFLETVPVGAFDVAYYDPMFLPRQKSALVKKDMQIMHELLGLEHATDLLLPTLNKIPRLVVKRAKCDPPYNKSMPHVDINAGLVRYERYIKGL